MKYVTILVNGSDSESDISQNDWSDVASNLRATILQIPKLKFLGCNLSWDKARCFCAVFPMVDAIEGLKIKTEAMTLASRYKIEIEWMECDKKKL